MNRNIALDTLKLVLAFMVVGIHTGFLSEISSAGKYVTGNGIFRMAVPIFLLISGFYFYPVVSKGKSLYWFKRVLQLYLFWTVVYLYFWFSATDVSFVAFVKMFLIGYFHLWYLPAMMGAALFVLLLQKLSLKKSLFLMLTVFVIGVAIQYIGSYHLIGNGTIDRLFNKGWINRNLFLGFSFFYMGYLINRFDLQGVLSVRQALMLSMLGVVLVLGESYFNYTHMLDDGGFDNLFSLLLLCPTLFLLFMNLDLQGKSKLLALYATGIYFVHPLFLFLYSNISEVKGSMLTFVVFISSLIASYFLIKLNNRVKCIL